MMSMLPLTKLVCCTHILLQDAVAGEVKDLYKGAVEAASGIEDLANALGSDVAVSVGVGEHGSPLTP